MLGLKNILKEIILEVSVDQLQTQFVDSGKISSEDFEEIKKTSPKSAHLTWLTKKVASGVIKTEDIYKWKDYLSMFSKFRNKYPESDIHKYQSPQDISKFIRTSVELKDQIKQDPSKMKGVSKVEKYKDLIIGNVDGFIVYEIPKGRTDLYNVSLDLGSGTEWCTATGNTKKYFNEYIRKDSLFIMYNPSTKEKFQFHYKDHQFMDKNDQSVI